MRPNRSIIQQKAKGKYDRNEQIRLLAKNGSNYAEIGRLFNLTRQAVRKIVGEASNG